MKESCLKWFGHVQRRVRMPMRKSGFIQVEGSKERKNNNFLILNKRAQKQLQLCRIIRTELIREEVPYCKYKER